MAQACHRRLENAPGHLDAAGKDGKPKQKNGGSRLCQCAEDLPGFEAWGALHDGELVASCLTFVCDDCYTVPHEQSDSSQLRNRVNNAIFYSVTHQALQRPGISKVFYCLESLDAPESVDEFKFRMGYTAQPVRQRVVFHPWVTPFVNTTSHSAVKQLLQSIRE